MPDRQVLSRLLQVVRESPTKDDPRLVIADWYESSGAPERADFIRLQLQVAHVERWAPERVHLDLQARAAMGDNEVAWRQDLPKPHGVQWGTFERGLVSKVAFQDLDTFVQHGPACLQATAVDHVVLRWPRLEDRPSLEAIEGLRELTLLGTLMEPDDMAWLAHSRLLSTIEALNIVESNMRAGALAHLLASPHLRQLKALRVPLHDFGNDGVALLVQADLPHLADLDLSVSTQEELGSGGRDQPTIDARGIADLLVWPALRQLHTLTLTGNQITTEGTRALLSSAAMSGLKTLGLRSIGDHNMYGDTDELARENIFEAFSDAHEALRLDALDVSENGFIDFDGEVNTTGMAALAECPALVDLKILDMDYQAGPAIAELLHAPWFDSVRIMSAADISGAEGLAEIINRQPAALHTLSLSSIYFWSQMEATFYRLATCPPLPSLLSLDIGGARIDSAELKSAGKLTCFPNLIALHLQTDSADVHGTYSEGAARAFASAPLGQQLKSLTVGYPSVDRLVPPVRIRLDETGDYTRPLCIL